MEEKPSLSLLFCLTGKSYATLFTLLLKTRLALRTREILEFSCSFDSKRYVFLLKNCKKEIVLAKSSISTKVLRSRMRGGGGGGWTFKQIASRLVPSLQDEGMII